MPIKEKAKNKEEVSYSANDHEEALYSMANKEFTDDLISFLKSRAPILYLTCNEERRLKTYLQHLSSVIGYRVVLWDCYLGEVDLQLNKQISTDDAMNLDPTDILNKIVEQAINDKEQKGSYKAKGINGTIYVLLDFHKFLESEMPDIERRLKTFANIESMTHIIMTGPFFSFNSTLQDYVSVLDFPHPNENEIEKTLDSLVKRVADRLPDLSDKVIARKEEIIKSANGLTLQETSRAFSKSLVKYKDFDVNLILKEKEQIIKKRGTLEYFPSQYNISDIGGLENFTSWIKKRKHAFSNEAREYGLPPLRGVLLLGIPGTGKSLAAKAAAGYFELPLIRLDFGRLFNSLVGESERAARDVIQLAEAVAPCLLGETDITVNNKRIQIEKLFNKKCSENNEVSIFNDENGNEIQKVVYLNKNSQDVIRGYNGDRVDNIKLKAMTRNVKKEKLIRIKTKSGKEIVVTKNHLLMGENGKMKEAKYFKSKDRISIVYDNSIQ